MKNNLEPNKERPNKSQQKRDMLALRDQTAFLCSLKKSQQEKLQLGASVNDALDEMNRIKNPNAQKRHLQFVNRLLAEHENIERILEQLYHLQNPHLAQQKLEREVENYYSKLLESNQSAIDELLTLGQVDNRQLLLQSIRNAQKEAATYTEDEKLPQSLPKQKKLKSFLRDLLKHQASDG